MRAIWLAAGACAALAAARAGDAPLVLTVSTRAGNADVFLVNPNTGDALNLTCHEAADGFPAWSPDGRRIAFVSDRFGGTANVFVMDADGENVRRLTNATRDAGVKCSKPSWSGDGGEIAYAREWNGGSEVVAVGIDGGGGPRLVAANAREPAWSPDGSKIAFASHRAGKGYRLWVAEADGSNPKELTAADNPAGHVYPAWSPDGRRIAYTDWTGGSFEVFACDADGGNRTQLSGQGGLNTAAAWLPGGKAVSFAHIGRGGAALMLVGPDGGRLPTPEALRRDPPWGVGFRPAWRPE
jgi:TolB protein